VGALEGMGALGPNEDECRGIPDLGSLVVLPWDPRFAVACADLEYSGRPYSHDSRHVLRRQLAAGAELGYEVRVGIEPEVYGDMTRIERREASAGRFIASSRSTVAAYCSSTTSSRPATRRATRSGR
jgi:glutamine synthetase